jgi:hypothetical protein
VSRDLEKFLVVSGKTSSTFAVELGLADGADSSFFLLGALATIFHAEQQRNPCVCFHGILPHSIHRTVSGNAAHFMGHDDQTNLRWVSEVGFGTRPQERTTNLSLFGFLS